MAYPFSIGGIEIRNHELAQILKKKHQIHFFCVKLWDGPDVIEREGVTYHGVCRYKKLHDFSGKRSLWEPLKFSLSIFRPLVTSHFDIVSVDTFPYFHCFSAFLAGKLSGNKTIFVWHGYLGDYWYEYLGLVRGLIAKMVERTVTRLPVSAVSVSQTVRLKLSKGGLGSIVNYNGVREMVRKQVERTVDVIFVGRLCHQKNLPLLIDAVHCLKDHRVVSVWVVGNGPDMEEIKLMIEMKGLSEQFHFVGEIGHDEVRTYLERSKMLVLTSRWEGFGIVVVEANSCGVPVITVDEELNAAKELICPESGLVVPSDPGKLAEAIYYLLEDAESLHRLSGNALVESKKYSWDRSAKELEDYYLELKR